MQRLSLQHGKEHFGACHGRHGMQRLALQVRQWHPGAVRTQGIGGQSALQAIGMGGVASRRQSPCMQHKIHRAWPGLTQGPRWQQETIAHALFVEDADLQIARQGQVLQAIVANDTSVSG